MFSGVHARTSPGRFVPGFPGRQILSPERKIATLGRADVIDGASVVKKNAVPVGEIVARSIGVATTPHVFGNDGLPVEIFGFFEKRAQGVKFGGGEIDDAGLAAAALAATLAGKLEAVFPKWRCHDSTVWARVRTSTRCAPLAIRVCAHATEVDPVVYTSSMRRMQGDSRVP